MKNLTLGVLSLALLCTLGCAAKTMNYNDPARPIALRRVEPIEPMAVQPVSRLDRMREKYEEMSPEQRTQMLEALKARLSDLQDKFAKAKDRIKARIQARIDTVKAKINELEADKTITLMPQEAVTATK